MTQKLKKEPPKQLLEEFKKPDETNQVKTLK